MIDGLSYEQIIFYTFAVMAIIIAFIPSKMLFTEQKFDDTVKKDTKE